MTGVLTVRTMHITEEIDIIHVRQAVREVAVSVGLSLVDQTKIVTAASELARNTLLHGGGGLAEVELEEADRRTTVWLVFTDEGPGITDVERALTEGYSTEGGLGLGLTGARKLADEFQLSTTPGKGTKVSVGFHASTAGGG